jgi:hypothetical protein
VTCQTPFARTARCELKQKSIAENKNSFAVRPSPSTTVVSYPFPITLLALKPAGTGFTRPSTGKRAQPDQYGSTSQPIFYKPYERLLEYNALNVTAQVEPQQVELELQPYDTPENRKLLLAGGEPVDPKARLGTFSDEKFEHFTSQIVLAYLKPREGYVKVCNFGGANDRGRDVIGYLDDKTQDIFQCKNYESPLTPVDVYKEIAKILYYAFKGNILEIRNYYLVARKGVGATLGELLEKPENLKIKIVEQWDDHCSTKIIRGRKIALEGEFKAYFDSFDFSKIKHYTPDELIEMHSNTKYHAVMFGGTLGKRRKVEVPEDIEERESLYVLQMMEAFSERESSILLVPNDLGINNLALFNHYRRSFFSADALRVFARDSLPDEGDFHSFVSEIGDAIMTPFHTTRGVYDKMVACVNFAVQVPIHNNPLEFYIAVLDKIGACHHLVNSDKLKWKM